VLLLLLLLHARSQFQRLLFTEAFLHEFISLSRRIRVEHARAKRGARIFFMSDCPPKLYPPKLESYSSLTVSYLDVAFSVDFLGSPEFSGTQSGERAYQAESKRKKFKGILVL
jgi:hypothetical protein